MRPLLRYRNQMGERHAIPVNQIADTFKREGVTHASAKMLCDDNNPLRHFIRHISEVVDVCFRDDEAFAGRSWLQRHESSDDIVLVYEARRSLLRNDLAEDAAHTVSTFGVPQS